MVEVKTGAYSLTVYDLGAHRWPYYIFTLLHMDGSAVRMMVEGGRLNIQHRLAGHCFCFRSLFLILYNNETLC